MYITLYDFGLFVLISMMVIVSAYLIAILRQAILLFNQARQVLAAHDKDIRETLSLLPVALMNLNLLCVSMTETIGQTSHAVRSLKTDLADTADGLHDGVETFIFYVKVIGEILKSVFSKIG
ncbi:hypothetical protein HSX37_04895|uniref:DUF948 domain-containing protein n=1 Tax=Dendrosporobacter quercicolus TaxID=146817 RepID=A0A1G9NN40_9FIRM|nr:hypothetical protein [Dendrosporobacter quercicolus]NSL47380.1 hypothetical protein [Dendrosporobacter quercicolus DSM 1736]SDL87425.1 hypothetical protein SAMN04488502_1011057 [Dendrosporobacter quercicolus]